MNKKTKIATAVVATVMAGTMTFGLFGCGPKLKKEQDKFEVAAADADLKDVTLNLDIGDKFARSVSFKYGELLSGTIKLPDGKDYTTSSLKPAWENFAKELGVKFNDAFSVESDKLKTAADSTAQGGTLADRDIITDGATSVSNYKDKLLNVNNYLDEMPNYKAFLEANPVVQMSLTSDTTTGAMYYVPYFDGNNDIEKYEIAKKNWIEALLDNTAGGDTTTTFKSHATAKSSVGDKASAASFMGQTGSWNVAALDKNGAKLEGGITVNYDKALAAAKDTSKPLGAAVNTAAGKAYNGTSGNIVDILNFVINEKKGEVNGANLLKVTQEYIKVAYYKGNTDTAMYTQDGYKLSDVFNGYSAAWDVDLFVALGRCLTTNPALLLSGNEAKHVGDEGATALSNLYLLTARQGNMQRMSDNISMIGQLYGIRGLESKNLYSYIDKDGNLQDVRANPAAYAAMEKFGALYKEGLICPTGSKDDAKGLHSTYDSTVVQETLMTYDYVNSQTPTGFQLDEGTGVTKYKLEEGYNFSPILTPVSKWNDGADKYMRFTESWRTTKDTGFCIPVDNVKNNPTKLRAVLKFIDTMFSNDGQIMLTYGPMADKDGKGGFWYNEEYDANKHKATDGWGKFTFKGKDYASKVEYSGVYQPTFTDNTMQSYYGNEVNGFKFKKNGGGASSSAANNWGATDATLNYTNYARYVIGSALPIGLKLQSFEFQLTSTMGRTGALIVDKAMKEGVILHTKNEVTENPWYTVVPTVLPYTDAQINENKTTYKKIYDGAKDTYFTTNKNATTNLFWVIVTNGYDATELAKDQFKNLGLSGTITSESVISALREKDKLNDFIAAKNSAWQKSSKYYKNFLSK